MDSCLSDWNTELGVEIPLSCQMKPLGVDHNDLVELLWQNGEVVLNSQNHRKPIHDIPKFKSNGNLNNPIQEDETAAWMNCPIDEAFEKEFCAKLMSETPLSNPLDATHLFPSSYFTPIQVPPPPPRFTPINTPRENQNLGQIRNIFEGCSQVTHNEIPVCSGITVGSSHCGSNQVANDAGYKKILRQKEQNEMETLEQPITSSSGGSGNSSVWKTSNQSNDNSRQKRKSIDMEESECRSDGTESNKSSQKSGTTRKSRVAEVHNLSERRRRDRINDKMKALQELIPHSNKSDKASVLDEAIEYMKSLQLQLQLMWMGRGMAPMMIPAMQNYISRMGLGMAPTTLPQIQDLMRLQRFPSVEQAMTLPSAQNQATITQSQSMSNPVNYQNQMQNPCFPEQYANYMRYQSMQNNSQPINMFNFGSHSTQQSHILTRPSNVNGYIG